MAHSITGEVSLERPHLKLVLMVVAEHEDAIVERDWLRHLDQVCTRVIVGNCQHPRVVTLAFYFFLACACCPADVRGL